MIFVCFGPRSAVFDQLRGRSLANKSRTSGWRGGTVGPKRLGTGLRPLKSMIIDENRCESDGKHTF